MRTTILLDDKLAEKFRETAQQRGQSLSAFLVEAGRSALGKEEPDGEAFNLITFGEGGTQPNINLDKTSEITVQDDIQRHGQ